LAYQSEQYRDHEELTATSDCLADPTFRLAYKYVAKLGQVPKVSLPPSRKVRRQSLSGLLWDVLEDSPQGHTVVHVRVKRFPLHACRRPGKHRLLSLACLND
jgi:hypothetical protein